MEQTWSTFKGREVAKWKNLQALPAQQKPFCWSSRVCQSCMGQFPRVPSENVLKSMHIAYSNRAIYIYSNFGQKNILDWMQIGPSNRDFPKCFVSWKIFTATAIQATYKGNYQEQMKNEKLKAWSKSQQEKDSSWDITNKNIHIKMQISSHFLLIYNQFHNTRIPVEKKQTKIRTKYCSQL